MKLVPYDLTKVNAKGYKMSKNQKILEEFRNSDLDCAEVTEFTQCSATTCAASLNASIKRYRLNTLRAIIREGRVFLIKEPI